MNKSLPLALALTLLPLSPLIGGTLLFSDNFNVADSPSLDAADLTGRSYGLLGTQVAVRSSRIQHNISNRRLNFLRYAGSEGGDGRLRFHNTANLAEWTDFASSNASATILEENGLRVEFDWYPSNNTNGDWIAFMAGINAMSAGEPGTRVNDAGTDFGVLVRPNGTLTQWFDNGTPTQGNSFLVDPLKPRRVMITLRFNSFANNALVQASTWVDDELVVDGANVTWNNNNGTLLMELGSYFSGNSIDNLYISGLDGLHPRLTSASMLEFPSSIANNGTVGTFSATLNGEADNATFQLVAGEGDTDNDKFKIAGGQLQSNGFNFSTLPHGTSLSVRVRATSADSSKTAEWVYFPRVMSDTDGDGLPDDWELSWGTDASWDLTKLSASGDFDGDGLTDLDELNLSYNAYPTPGPHPGLSPVLADTDEDGLSDKDELTPPSTSSRPATSPVQADTDRDGLSDLEETNTGLFTSAADTGSNPTDYDSDDDGFPDNYEVGRGSSPVDGLALPPLPGDLEIHPVTDADHGFDSSLTYTHAVSGGYAVTVHGVPLEALTVGSGPANLTWEAKVNENQDATKSAITAFNLNNWIPANNGISGSDLRELFGGFTYSGNGDVPGAYQTYSLTGLTPGTDYVLNIYVRPWDGTGGSGRPSNVTFTNGTDSITAYVLEDRPAIMLGNNGQPAGSAFRLSLPYTAQTDILTVEARVPVTTIPISGSWHLYALTNAIVEGSGPEPAGFAITGITAAQSPPSVTLTFGSEPGVVYAVDYSTEMKATGLPGGWTQLTGSLPSAGSQTTYQDTTAAGTADRIFYRVRRVSP